MVNGNSLTHDGAINHYAAVHPRTEKGTRLYDLENDPHESQNQAKVNLEVTDRLKKIQEWRQEP
ncbi:MAG TPA: hypothetical protein EYQ50_24605 [Verrucomicrobiales bacterium]|jgi:hypothetical protein|nr:hypothetical protein [Verrucomicrobiales bacterium]